MKKIQIQTRKVAVSAELNDTITANLIYDALPITATVNTWGEEIYFPIPVKSKLEEGVTVVNIGDLGYWPPQHCFCIFFGKTPVSTDEEIRPASAVTIIGKLIGNPKVWLTITDGEPIKIIPEKKNIIGGVPPNPEL